MHSFFRIVTRPRLFASAFQFRVTRTFATPAAMDKVHISVHNSLSPGAPVPLEPLKQGQISWYACGPTVYDLSHVCTLSAGTAMLPQLRGSSPPVPEARY